MTDKQRQILSTYAALLNEQGLKGASLDLLAKRVGLSKAGLLHHYRSRATLDAALIDWLVKLVEADLDKMSADLSKAVDYYLSSSFHYSSPLEQLIIAVNRLGQSGNRKATKALREARDAWYAVLVDALDDPVLAKLALLAGDGISYHLDITIDQDDGFVNQQTLTRIVAAIEAARDSASTQTG